MKCFLYHQVPRGLTSPSDLCLDSEGFTLNITLEGHYVLLDFSLPTASWESVLHRHPTGVLGSTLEPHG